MQTQYVISDPIPLLDNLSFRIFLPSHFVLEEVKWIKNMITDDELLPGVKEFLIDAREKGHKIALGSASKNARLILERLDLVRFFDAIVDGNLVAKAKPDPEVFVMGLRCLEKKLLNALYSKILTPE